jgi:glycosyltransferase involved in cell wall biosynthesis
MIDISIIVPIYNAEKYLKKCLDSLVNQTKKELEFILVNDGSTDTTEDIIKTYKDKRIKYFKNKNQGIGKTRNFGIEKSSGKYIMFVDSDDYLEKDACELLYKKSKELDSDLVVCDFYKVYENEELEEVRLIDFKPTSLKKMPSLINEINLSPWNKIYKRELITNNNLKFIENLKYEDAPFVLQALFNAENISKVNECLNYYVIHGNSETTVRDKKCFDILKIIDIIRSNLKKEKYLKEELDKLTVRIVTNYTIQQRMQKDKKIGMEFIDKAFAYLKKEVPDYKNNKYYEKRGIKRIIEKNKTLTKLYCRIYRR